MGMTRAKAKKRKPPDGAKKTAKAKKAGTNSGKKRAGRIENPTDPASVGGMKGGSRHSPKLREEYLLFAQWIAVPKSLRNPRTQQAFGAKYEVSVEAICDWKNRPDFWEKVEEYRSFWGKERTGDVIETLYKMIRSKKGGSVEAVRLWLQSFSNLTEKVEVTGTIRGDQSLENMTDGELDAFIKRKVKVVKALGGLA